MKKDYSYAIDWAVASPQQPKLIWHNEPGGGGSFVCEEKVDDIRDEAVKILRQYTQGNYAWDYAATSACEHDKTGACFEAMKDIELSVIAPCQQPKGNMIRVRISEDWNSCLKDVPNRLKII